MRRRIPAALLVALAAAGPAAAQGLGELWRRPAARAGEVSSFDRSGGNRDHGNFEKKGSAGARLMASIEGSGWIQRIWSANPKGILVLESLGDGRVLFEGPFRSLFDPLGRPDDALAGPVGGGFVAHRPFVFRGGLAAWLKPEWEGADLDCYYQIGYGLAPAAQDPAALERRLAADWLRAARPPADYRTLAHHRLTLRRRLQLARIDGAGVVLELRLQAGRPPGRGPRFIARYGGERGFEVPLADLFGLFPRGAVLQTAAVGGVGRLRWFRLPMPFTQGIEFELRQDDPTAPPLDLDFEVRYIRRSFERPPRLLRARFAVQDSVRGRPIEVLRVAGAGHYAGLVACIHGLKRGLGFLEGDERITADGRLVFRGTGTEDYFDGAWYFRGGPFAYPFASLAAKDEEAGWIAVARFHVPDPVGFERDFAFELEHGGRNDRPGVRYETLAWYYGGRGSAARAAPWPLRRHPKAPAELRFEAEEFVGAKPFRFTPEGREAEVSRAMVLLLPGGRRRFVLRGLPPGSYLPEVVVGPGERPQRAAVRLLGSRIEIQAAAGRLLRRRGSAVVHPGGELSVEVDVEDGPFLFDRLDFVPYARNRLRRFLVCGPFPSPKRSGLERVFPPERDPGLGSEQRKNERFETAGPKSRGRWFSIDVRDIPDGYVDLRRWFSPSEHVVAYALAEVTAEHAGEAVLSLGTDDGFKLWWNGRLLRSGSEIRASEPGQERLQVHLRRGVNVLLLKVENHRGWWGFHLGLARR